MCLISETFAYLPTWDSTLSPSSPTVFCQNLIIAPVLCQSIKFFTSVSFIRLQASQGKRQFIFESLIKEHITRVYRCLINKEITGRKWKERVMEGNQTNRSRDFMLEEENKQTHMLWRALNFRLRSLGYLRVLNQG